MFPHDFYICALIALCGKAIAAASGGSAGGVTHPAVARTRAKLITGKGDVVITPGAAKHSEVHTCVGCGDLHL